MGFLVYHFPQHASVLSSSYASCGPTTLRSVGGTEFTFSFNLDMWLSLA